ncbi:NAD-dependent epimerase/dehydratase family protein [Chloroflexota bacterium]
MSHDLAQDLDHILEHTRGLWDELRGQRIFITGGTGFLGCWVLESFAWANDRLGLGTTAVVLTRHPDAFLKKAPHLATHPAIQLYTGDVRSFEFPPGPFSHVMHLATDEGHRLTVKDPLLMLDTILHGAWHTLDFTRYCGAKKFLCGSSGAVYGRQPPEMTHIPEDYLAATDIRDTAAVYVEGKRLAELLCLRYHEQYGIEGKVFRGFSFVGPYLPLDIHYAIGNFIGDALRGRPIQVKGDGTPYRSYLYAADAVIWLWTMLCRGESGRIYNMGSESALTIAEVAARVAEATEPPGVVRIAGHPTPGQPPERYVPSTQRARTELGLQQYIDLPEAIRRTIR